jgi:hypothetical protein
MARVPASERTRNELKRMISGEGAADRSRLALIRASETWKNVVISEFELRQLEQLREQLNDRHSERTAKVVKVPASRSRIPSNVRT